MSVEEWIISKVQPNLGYCENCYRCESTFWTCFEKGVLVFQYFTCCYTASTHTRGVCLLAIAGEGLRSALILSLTSACVSSGSVSTLGR